MSSTTQSLSKSYFLSSVVKKQIMAVTGLLLCGFLAGHLAGNILIIVSPDLFNQYGHALVSNKPLLYTAEAGLIVLFLVHLTMAAKLTVENNNARPEKYFIKQKTGRGATFASSTMPYTGVIILIFLVTHLMHFKYGTVYMTTVSGVEMRDLYRTVMEFFANPAGAAWYVFAMVAMAIHVSHGFWSAIQSFGIWHPRYTPCIRKLGIGYAVVVGAGFAALALYGYIQGVSA